jgi:hypothetical protein
VAFHYDPRYAAKNAADLEAHSVFNSAFRHSSEDIRPTKDNSVCYDFNERRVGLTHNTIQTNGGDAPLELRLVQTSADGKNWREVAREENNEQLNGCRFAGTFAAAGGGEYRSIGLVAISRSHSQTDRPRDDEIRISAWKIFASVVEQAADSSDAVLLFPPALGQESPSTAQNPGHTWAPSPPPRGVRATGTTGTQADLRASSCRRSFQPSLGSCGVTGAWVKRLQFQRPSPLGLRTGTDLTPFAI